MRHILLNAPGELGERQVEMPPSRPGEALIAIKRVGVCGSDFHAFAGRHPIYTYPRVLGHELSGEIVRIPANEMGLHAGDLCAIDHYIYCGRCRACSKGRTNCCEQLRL